MAKRWTAYFLSAAAIITILALSGCSKSMHFIGKGQYWNVELRQFGVERVDVNNHYAGDEKMIEHFNFKSLEKDFSFRGAINGEQETPFGHYYRTNFPHRRMAGHDTFTMEIGWNGKSERVLLKLR